MKFFKEHGFRGILLLREETVSRIHQGVNMKTRKRCVGLAVVALAISSFAAEIAWIGTTETGEWSNAINWEGGECPMMGSDKKIGDTALFVADGTPLVSTVDEGFTNEISFVWAETIHGGSVTFHLETNLFINAKDIQDRSALIYGETIPKGEGVEWNLHGHILGLSSEPGSGRSTRTDFFGVYNFDQPNSSIRTTRNLGSGSENILHNLGGSEGEGTAVFNITASNCMFGHRTGSTSDRNHRPLIVNVWPGSKILVSDGASLVIRKERRNDQESKKLVEVNNHGLIDISSGGTLDVSFAGEFGWDDDGFKTVYTLLRNEESGEVCHDGVLGMDVGERGTNYVENCGFWKVSDGAEFIFKADQSKRKKTSSKTYFGGMVFTNHVNGLFASDSDAVVSFSKSLPEGAKVESFDNLLTFVNHGTIAPGGTNDVASLQLAGVRMITSLDGILDVNLQGDEAGQYDTLFLEDEDPLRDGVLDVSNGLTVRLTIGSEYRASKNQRWTVVTYESVVLGEDGTPPLSFELQGPASASFNPNYFKAEFENQKMIVTYALPGTVLILR